VLSLPTVWNFADCANALMAVPNLISLLVLHGVIAKDTQLYFKDVVGK
jgi:AGCS family alanine or glycine:cation symporter